MSHEQVDNITGIAVGGAFALLGQAGELLQASTWGWDLLHTVLFGLVGGACGYLGKRLIQRATTKRTKTGQ